MKYSNMINEFLITLLILILYSCNSQNNKALKIQTEITNTSSENYYSQGQTNSELIYFSTDNGMAWENRSKGLPQNASTGLGGVAVSSTMLGVATKENGVYLFDFPDSIWISIPTDTLILNNNIGAMIFYKNNIYVGTQSGGVFCTEDMGKTWTNLNTGLDNLTIRKFAEINHKLYTGTNAGLYSYNEIKKYWELEYGNSTLQVNGITGFEGSVYIGTNQGAFSSPDNSKEWKQVLRNHSLHNISSDNKAIYAMTYNELFSSVDKGNTWKSIQKGLPEDLYTFNVIKNGNNIIAGQWDGIYYKTNPDEDWILSRRGLPEKFAVTNLKSYNGILIISTSERKLNK